MRLAIIGCGSIGMRHLKTALALGCEVFVCDADRDREQAAVDAGAQLWLSPSDSPVDAAMICTPYDKHLPWADGFVKRRVPVFVEKPLGSLDQIKEWRRLVQASADITTQVGYQCRFQPKARAMKLLFDAPTYAGFHCDVDLALWPGKTYGPLLLEASHDLDLLLWMSGQSSVVRAFVDDGMYYVQLDEDEEFAASIGDNNRGRYYREWSVGKETQYDEYGASCHFSAPEELGDQMYVDELQHFLDCVRRGVPTDVPLADGLRVLEVCQQVEEKVRQHT